MPVLIFVYGTLKSGFPNHYLIENKTDGFCIQRGLAETVERFPLVIATRYNIPFMLHAPGKGKNIKGELYEVDEKRLEKLDNLEAYPYLYERRDVILKKKSGDETECNIVQAQAYFLVNYRPFLLDSAMYSEYDNSIEGKIYVSPFKRETINKDPKHWWFEVHTEYEDFRGNVLNK